MIPRCSANCPRCGQAFTWRGKPADRPACPHCGATPPDPHKLAAQDARIARKFNPAHTPPLFGQEQQ